MVPIAQRYLRPTVVSMYNYVQPLVAVLFTVAIGLDTFGPTKGFAALCVFVGVWLVTKSKSRAQLEAEQAQKKGRRSRTIAEVKIAAGKSRDGPGRSRMGRNGVNRARGEADRNGAKPGPGEADRTGFGRIEVEQAGPFPKTAPPSDTTRCYQKGWTHVGSPFFHSIRRLCLLLSPLRRLIAPSSQAPVQPPAAPSGRRPLRIRSGSPRPESHS